MTDTKTQAKPALCRSERESPQRPAALRAGRVLGVVAMSGALLLATGCASSASQITPRQQVAAGEFEATAVSDETFATSVHSLIVDGKPSAQRQALLAGVVRRQLTHASERFKAKQNDRGLASVLGALYLIRAGEYHPAMIDAQGEQTLAMALDVIGATGDEGRSLALYNLRKASVAAGSAPARDIDEHLAALGRWIEEQDSKPGMGAAETAGSNERRAVGRSLLEPSDEALKAATLSTSRWVDAGLTFQAQYQANPRAPRKREEAVESFRATSSAAATIVALHLRHGDAAGAIEALSESSIYQVTPSGLLPRLKQAAKPDDAAAWQALLELFLRTEGPDPETGIDNNLVQAAAFGIAIEAYRRDPTNVDVATQLAAALSAYGMTEVVPTVLATAARSHAEPRVLSGMLAVIASELVREESNDDPQSARRIIKAAAPLLELADQPALRGKLRPPPARVRFIAATISGRAGQLDEARALLLSSVKDEPSADASRLLADIERQLGNTQGAIESLSAVLASPEAKHDRLIEGEARLALSDIHREAGERDKARDQALLALQATLDARKPLTPNAARAERLLARVLDRLGDDAGAARATDRAISVSKADPRQLAMSVLEALARAYVSRDVRAARSLAQHAIGANMQDDELVYIGLWLQILEREQGARTDGTAQKLLERIEQGTSWPSRLASWARGKLSDSELLSFARTPGQRTEAAFYSALAQRASGQQNAAETALREVARSQALDLMEAQIARDLLAGNERRLPGPTPAGIPLRL